MSWLRRLWHWWRRRKYRPAPLPKDFTDGMARVMRERWRFGANTMQHYAKEE